MGVERSFRRSSSQSPRPSPASLSPARRGRGTRRVARCATSNTFTQDAITRHRSLHHEPGGCPPFPSSVSVRLHGATRRPPRIAPAVLQPASPSGRGFVFADRVLRGRASRVRMASSRCVRKSPIPTNPADVCKSLFFAADRENAGPTPGRAWNKKRLGHDRPPHGADLRRVVSRRRPPTRLMRTAWRQ